MTLAALIAALVVLAAAVAGLIAVALKWGDAERRCGDARADESAVAVRLEVALANAHNASARADDEKRRADALDVQYQKLLASAPVAGADGVLSAEAAAAHPGAGGPAAGGAVPHRGAGDGAGLDDLRAPGE